MSTPSLSHESPVNRWVYGKLNMATYDLTIVRASCRWVWQCPNRVIRELYDRNVTSAHLDIGPGPGFYVARAPFPPDSDIHLLDLNPLPLELTARRVSQHRTTTHQASALDPFPMAPDSVDSVGSSMMMHCLPGGTIGAKAAMFDHVATVLRPGGRFFGATVLGTPVSSLSRKVLHVYNNKWGAFDNVGDTADALRTELESRFDEVEVTTRGNTALWEVTSR